MPRHQFIKLIDLVIMDALEDVCQIGQRVEAVQLCRFDDGHRPRQSFCAGIGTREEPVFLSYSNRAQGAFCRVVVDC